MKRSALLLALVASAFFAAGSQAQTLKSVALDAAQIKPGESVKATVVSDMSSGGNCGLKVHWGDGQFTETKVNQDKDANMVLTHKYDKAGKYEVMVEPKRNGVVLKCLGVNQKASVTVAEPAKAAAPAASKPVALTAANACPAGWKITAAGVNKKTQAFTCTAVKKTDAAPDPKPACPGDLTYFENLKKGQLGCKP